MRCTTRAPTAENSVSRSSKCWNTERTDTPACSAMRGAVGRRSPASTRAMQASTMASRVRYGSGRPTVAGAVLFDAAGRDHDKGLGQREAGAVCDSLDPGQVRTGDWPPLTWESTMTPCSTFPIASSVARPASRATTRSRHQRARRGRPTAPPFVQSFANVAAFAHRRRARASSTPAARSPRQPCTSAVRGWTRDRLDTAVFTHGHIDHVFGVELYEDEAADQRVAGDRTSSPTRRSTARFDRYVPHRRLQRA